MEFKFNPEKNSKLISERKISFTEIIEAFNQGAITEVALNPNQKKYPGQQAFYVKLRNEIYVVPFVQKDAKTIFLKTIFPSRKARRIFLQKSV